MMGRRDHYKGPGEHPITCRVCRRMVGKKFKTKEHKERLNRRMRRNFTLKLQEEINYDCFS